MQQEWSQLFFTYFCSSGSHLSWKFSLTEEVSIHPWLCLYNWTAKKIKSKYFSSALVAFFQIDNEKLSFELTIFENWEITLIIHKEPGYLCEINISFFRREMHFGSFVSWLQNYTHLTELHLLQREKWRSSLVYHSNDSKANFKILMI